VRWPCAGRAVEEAPISWRVELHDITEELKRSSHFLTRLPRNQAEIM
jgi:hypothetical protein